MYIVGERKVLKKQKKILQVGNDRCKKKKDLKSLLVLLSPSSCLSNISRCFNYFDLDFVDYMPLKDDCFTPGLLSSVFVELL